MRKIAPSQGSRRRKPILPKLVQRAKDGDLCQFSIPKKRLRSFSGSWGSDFNWFARRLRSVRVDSIGMGHNFGLHLRDQRFPVELVNVGMACESRPEWPENDPAGRFVNLKAQYYQELADAFERNEIQGLRDDVTIGQLAGLLYEVDSHGRIRIESKESARARGVPSPDRAEALMLALAKPPQKMEWISVRDFRRTRFDAKPSEDYDWSYPARGFGFRDLGYDDGYDDLPRRRRWPRGWELF